MFGVLSESKRTSRTELRASKEAMAAHRGQIVAAAAKRFRECGFDGISVADIMKEVGLRSFVSYFCNFSMISENALSAAAATNSSLEEKCL
jgi:TetR/AcrR family transcriptional repressor of nem operon